MRGKKVRQWKGSIPRIFRPLPPVRPRGDVGIAPYAGRRFPHSTKSSLHRQGSPPHPSGLRPATLSKQERALFPRREEAFPSGEGGTARGRDG